MKNAMTMLKPATTFTSEEEKILTALDAAAHDLMRFEGQVKGETPPCWLVCSNEIREQYRKRVVDLVVAQGGLLLRASDPSVLFDRLVSKSLVDAWRAAELEAKVGREEQNPRAFFC